MKRFFKIIGILLLLLVALVVYIMASTGFFRSVSNSYDGPIREYAIPGAEDFAISRTDGFLIISSDDRAARRDGRPPSGGLYYLDIKKDDAQPFLLKADDDVTLFPHGISMMAIDSQRYRLLAVNHVSSGDEAVSSLDPSTRHSIEEYELRDCTLTYIRTYEDPHVNSPNDVVIADESRFYVTNDHGSTTKLGLMAEDYLGFKRSNVVYFDGNDYQKVAGEIAYANGINLDTERKLLFVASPRDFLVKAYQINDDGSLDFQVDIPCNSGVDNIELDPEGKLWIGSHPRLLAFSSYSMGKSPISPSEIITIDYVSPDEIKVSSLYESDGSDMSASTVAIPFEGKVYLGNVMDEHFIVLDQQLLRQ